MGLTTCRVKKLSMLWEGRVDNLVSDICLLLCIDHFALFGLLASVQIPSMTLGQYFSILTGLEKYVFREMSV